MSYLYNFYMDLSLYSEVLDWIYFYSDTLPEYNFEDQTLFCEGLHIFSSYSSYKYYYNVIFPQGSLYGEALGPFFYSTPENIINNFNYTLYLFPYESDRLDAIYDPVIPSSYIEWIYEPSSLFYVFTHIDWIVSFEVIDWNSLNDLSVWELLRPFDYPIPYECIYSSYMNLWSCWFNIMNSICIYKNNLNVNYFIDFIDLIQFFLQNYFFRGFNNFYFNFIDIWFTNLTLFNNFYFTPFTEEDLSFNCLNFIEDFTYLYQIDLYHNINGNYYNYNFIKFIFLRFIIILFILFIVIPLFLRLCFNIYIKGFIFLFDFINDNIFILNQIPLLNLLYFYFHTKFKNIKIWYFYSEVFIFNKYIRKRYYKLNKNLPVFKIFYIFDHYISWNSFWLGLFFLTFISRILEFFYFFILRGFIMFFFYFFFTFLKYSNLLSISWYVYINYILVLKLYISLNILEKFWFFIVKFQNFILRYLFLDFNFDTFRDFYVGKRAISHFYSTATYNTYPPKYPSFILLFFFWLKPKYFNYIKQSYQNIKGNLIWILSLIFLNLFKFKNIKDNIHIFKFKLWILKYKININNYLFILFIFILGFQWIIFLCLSLFIIFLLYYFFMFRVLKLFIQFNLQFWNTLLLLLGSPFYYCYLLIKNILFLLIKIFCYLILKIKYFILLLGFILLGLNNTLFFEIFYLNFEYFLINIGVLFYDLFYRLAYVYESVYLNDIDFLYDNIDYFLEFANDFFIENKKGLFWDHAYSFSQIEYMARRSPELDFFKKINFFILGVKLKLKILIIKLIFLIFFIPDSCYNFRFFFIGDDFLWHHIINFFINLNFIIIYSYIYLYFILQFIWKWIIPFYCESSFNFLYFILKYSKYISIFFNILIYLYSFYIKLKIYFYIYIKMVWFNSLIWFNNFDFKFWFYYIWTILISFIFDLNIWFKFNIKEIGVYILIFKFINLLLLPYFWTFDYFYSFNRVPLEELLMTVSVSYMRYSITSGFSLEYHPSLFKLYVENNPGECALPLSRMNTLIPFFLLGPNQIKQMDLFSLFSFNNFFAFDKKLLKLNIDLWDKRCKFILNSFLNWWEFIPVRRIYNKELLSLKAKIIFLNDILNLQATLNNSKWNSRFFFFYLLFFNSNLYLVTLKFINIIILIIIIYYLPLFKESHINLYNNEFNWSNFRLKTQNWLNDSKTIKILNKHTLKFYPQLYQMEYDITLKSLINLNLTKSEFTVLFKSYKLKLGFNMYNFYKNYTYQNIRKRILNKINFYNLYLKMAHNFKLWDEHLIYKLNSVIICQNFIDRFIYKSKIKDEFLFNFNKFLKDSEFKYLYSFLFREEYKYKIMLLLARGINRSSDLKFIWFNEPNVCKIYLNLWENVNRFNIEFSFKIFNFFIKLNQILNNNTPNFFYSKSIMSFIFSKDYENNENFYVHESTTWPDDLLFILLIVIPFLFLLCVKNLEYRFNIFDVQRTRLLMFFHFYFKLYILNLSEYLNYVGNYVGIIGSYDAFVVSDTFSFIGEAWKKRPMRASWLFLTIDLNILDPLYKYNMIFYNIRRLDCGINFFFFFDWFIYFWRVLVNFICAFFSCSPLFIFFSIGCYKIKFFYFIILTCLFINFGLINKQVKIIFNKKINFDLLTYISKVFSIKKIKYKYLIKFKYDINNKA